MANKGKRSIPTFAEKGGGSAQLGLRYRREVPADSVRPKLAVTAPRKMKAQKQESIEALALRQRDEDLKFTSCMNDVRNLCASTARVTMSFMAAEVAEREAMLQSVVKRRGQSPPHTLWCRSELGWGLESTKTLMTSFRGLGGASDHSRWRCQNMKPCLSCKMVTC
jgi:hypothetical protein